MKIPHEYPRRATRALCLLVSLTIMACEGESLQIAPPIEESLTPSENVGQVLTSQAVDAVDGPKDSEISSVLDDELIEGDGHSLADPITVDGNTASEPDPVPVDVSSERAESVAAPILIDDPATITEVVLVTGQSNALGALTSYDPALDVVHPRAYAFTENGWRIADLNQVWDLGWHPGNHPDTDPYNNFGFHFAGKVAERRPDRVIGFVLVTQPGASIQEWDFESELYVKIRDRVATALNDLPSKATIDGILWHQGETDWNDTPLYGSKLNQLIQNFRGESWFGSDRPFICGETAAAPVNNRLMALNNDGDRWTGCVEGNNLPTKSDGFHFSAEGLRIIGARYADKYIEMTEQP